MQPGETLVTDSNGLLRVVTHADLAAVVQALSQSNASQFAKNKGASKVYTLAGELPFQGKEVNLSTVDWANPSVTLKVADQFEQMKDFSFQELIRRFPFDAFEKLDPTTVRNWIEMIEYKGFNLEGMLRNMMQKQPCVDRLTDIMLLISFFMERGTNLVTMMKKMSPDGKAMLQSLIKTYSIVSKASSASNIAVTLSRVAIAFPWMTCTYSNYIQKNRIVNPGDMSSAAAGKTVPLFLQCIGFAPCIPEYQDIDKTERLLKAHSVWSAKLSKVIGKKSRQTEKERYIEALNFCRIGYQGSKIDQAVRLQWMHLWGIMSDSTDTASTTEVIDELAATYDKIVV